MCNVFVHVHYNIFKNQIEELNIQLEQFEGELESMEYSCKKKKVEKDAVSFMTVVYLCLSARDICIV